MSIYQDMSVRFTFAMAFVIATTLAAGQAKGGQKSTAPATGTGTRSAKALFITGMTVTPSTINFSATDPDLGLVAGSAASTVSFTLWFGSASNWTLTISSSTSTFSGCTTIPASAITATCTAGTASQGSAVCSAAGPLSTTGIQVASGAQGTIANFTVTVNFTLSDSWKYIAQTSPTCPLSLTYTLDAP